MPRRTLSERARRRLALLALLVGLPLYIAAAVSLVGAFNRPGVLVELLIFVALGLVWALPLRALFRGLSRPASAEAGAGGAGAVRGDGRAGGRRT